jgi:hypothetical protein|tara:strand:+ start:13440 stop:13541 length:102 start_codon:yes stop_codon:yes gene_type:complete
MILSMSAINRAIVVIGVGAKSTASSKNSHNAAQ